MMNRLTLFSLLTLVVIIAATVFVNLRAPQTEKEKPLFFPELAGKIETVSHISIKTFDETINLSRTNETWGIDEFDAYPALPDKVKSTVLGAADLRLNAPKTALERLYPRLGVEGPIADESTSTLLTLKDANMNSIVEVIVGKPRRSSAAQSTPGLYVRLPEDEQSYLVDGVLDISAIKTDWIERSILDIPSEEIQSVKIDHTDGDTFTLFKQEKGQEKFQLENMPAGKKLAPDILINRFGSLLEDIQIIAAKNKTSLETASDTIRARITTFDGLLVDITALEYDDFPYAIFSFAFDESLIAEQDGDIDSVKIQQYVDGLNSKLSEWAFEIQPFKYDILKKRSDRIVRDDRQNFSADEE